MKKSLLFTFVALFAITFAQAQCDIEFLSAPLNVEEGSTYTVSARYMELDFGSGSYNPAATDGFTVSCSGCSVVSQSGGVSGDAAVQYMIQIIDVSASITISATKQGGGCTASNSHVFNVVMPVELTSFKAEAQEKVVNLAWTTASELNNDYFVVERSFDGSKFEEVGKIVGAGTSYVEQSYEFVDETVTRQATGNTVFYRLAQYDLDGAVNIHETITVKIKHNNGFDIINIQDNADAMTIYFEAATAGTLSVDVFNMNGQILGQQTINAAEGYNAIDLTVNDLANGIFMVRMTNGQQQVVKKFFR